jgi:phospholipase/lecithinase/hemolysin
MKYGVLFGCAAAALIFAPVGASAAEGVSGGMSYAEIAGPVIGGIPGAVVGGVTGGVEGVLGIEHRSQYVAAREEYRPIHRATHIGRRHHRHNHHD